MEKTIYRFEDLQDKAKEKAREWCRNALYNDFTFECDNITETMTETLNNYDFDLKDKGLSWDLSYSQGDYVGLTGKIKDKKLHELIMKHLSNREKKRYKLMVVDGNDIEISHHVSYHHYYGQQFEVNVEFNIDDKCNLIENFANRIEEIAKKEVGEFVDELCSKLKRQGYSEIEYYGSDEYIDDLMISNEYEFDKEGNSV